MATKKNIADEGVALTSSDAEIKKLKEEIESLKRNGAANGTETANGNVIIRLDPDPSDDPKYVSVNGIAMFVPRGERVEIPRAYYEALKESIAAEENASKYIKEQKKKAKTPMIVSGVNDEE